MKFELTDETIHHDGVILHRIECIEEFGDVRIGDKGGWVESMDNLSQDEDAWIYGDAKVYNEAKVWGNATVSGEACIHGNAVVSGEALVNENADVYGKAEVSDNAIVSDHAVICDNAFIFGNAEVYDNAIIKGNAEVYENGQVYSKAVVSGFAMIHGHARVCGNAKVCGFVQISGNTDIVGNAEIENINDYMVFKNSWSSGRYFTWTRSNNMWQVGCFYGTGKELIEKAYADSQQKGDCYKAVVDCVENIIKFTSNE